MKKGRLEAFSDGVLAIIITIMVLELHVPHGHSLKDLFPLWPQFLGYVLSFIYVGIYWNNHHHLFYMVDNIDGSVLWANLNLLFWLSLIPFVTEWMGDERFSSWPVVLYGAVLIMCGVAYGILVRTLLKHANNPALAEALGDDRKGKWSVFIYAVAIVLAFFYAPIGIALYWAVAMFWIIPDTRIEKKITLRRKEGEE